MNRLLLLVMLCPAFARAEYVGDIVLGQTIDHLYDTYKSSDGSDLQRSVAGTAACHQDGSVSDITSGVTDSGTTAFNSNTGSNKMTIVATAGNSFSVGHNYDCGWRTATLNTVTDSFISVVSFSIENRTWSLGRIKARGAMVSGSSTSLIQLANGTLSVSGIWVGMTLRDVNNNEDATICSSTKSGGGNDTLVVSGLVTTPGSTDSYEVIRTGIPAMCVPTVAGSGLPKMDNNGYVYTAYLGPNGTPMTGPSASNLITFFDNGNTVSILPTMGGLYSAATNIWTTSVDGSINTKCALALTLAIIGGGSPGGQSPAIFTGPSSGLQRWSATVSSGARSGISFVCPP